MRRPWQRRRYRVRGEYVARDQSGENKATLRPGRPVRSGHRPADAGSAFSALSVRLLSVLPLFYATMPRNRRKKNTVPQETIPQRPQISEHSQVLTSTAIGLPLAVDCSDSSPSPMAVYPCVYRGGFVDSSGTLETFTSIVCQPEYGHLSPEV